MGTVTYMPGQSPEERRERTEKQLRVRSNLLAIFNHFGLEGDRETYEQRYEEVRNLPRPLEPLEALHRELKESMRQFEEDNAVIFHYNPMGFYVGYFDQDVGEVIRYRKGAE